jgi:hypothetical protein
MRRIAILLAAALLAGCTRSFSKPGAPLPGEPAAPTASLTAQAAATATAPAEAGASPTAALSPTPAATATLTAALVSALEFYPLRTGNSWIYIFRHANKPAGTGGVLLVTDTVVETTRAGDLFAAHVRRDVSVQEGAPSGLAWDAPGDFWLVLTGDELLRLPGERFDLSALDQAASVEARLPLPGEGCWLSAPGMRHSLPPDGDDPNLPGCRSATLARTVTVPAGDFYNCYALSETGADGTNLLQRYCPGVGLVMARQVGAGVQPGFSLELRGYLRQ